MSMSQALLPEFEQEMAGTRKTLERVPEAKFSWKPHAKSGSMVWLASHVADIPSWATMIIQNDSLDMEPGGKKMEMPPPPKTTKEMLDKFDNHVKEAKAAIAGVSDAELAKPWSLLVNGQTLFTMPKGICLRTWVLSHNVHHRAQLGVYLRLNDLPVPSLYGPSADEGGM